MIRQRELTEEAGKAAAIAKADELRRSCFRRSATTCTRWPPRRLPYRACAAGCRLLARGHRGLLATVEEVGRSADRAGGNLLDSSRLAAGVVRPELRPVYLEEVVQRALLRISRATGFRNRGGLDRVTVDVDNAVALADSGLLERVLVNLIDNALRYAPASPMVNAGTVGGGC